MQMAVIVHMMFGFYMYSNSQIFSGVLSGSTSTLSSSMGSSSGPLSGARLSQPHVVIYLVLFFIIVGGYVFTRVVNTFFPGFWGKMMCIFKCCKS